MAQAPAAGPMESGGSRPIPTGFQVIHGNRLENLRELAVEVIRRFPLAPLEEEVFLVHSNGIAQWLKLALARDRDDPELAGLGIAAAMTFSLPSRFLWQVYRAVLGSDAVATESPFDKDRMTWRLLRMLPAVTEQEGFAPLARFSVVRSRSGGCSSWRKNRRPVRPVPGLPRGLAGGVERG